MKFPGSNSGMWKRASQRRFQITLYQAIIFAVGAAFGSILTTVIGLEYASWLIIALCWPIAIGFVMFDRARERKQKAPAPAVRQWRVSTQRVSQPAPHKQSPRVRHSGSGVLHRVK
ncbi:MAG: hypothetical protein ACREP6_15205 [Candidatus Binataceae bacterium]